MDRDDSNCFHGRAAESWMMAEVSQLRGGFLTPHSSADTEETSGLFG